MFSMIYSHDYGFHRKTDLFDVIGIYVIVQ